MSIDNVTIHQGYELPNGTNTLAHDVTRLINALTSVDSDVFLRPLASSSTYVGTTAIALNRASAAQALTGITSIDGSAATLTTSRTLWGQSFNGSANVTGNLTSVGNITGSGAISLTTAAASNLSLTSGTTGVVSLDSGTTGAINIGTGANTKTITIGSSTGTVQLPTAVTKVGQTSLIQGGAVNVTFPTLAGTLVGSGDTGTVTSTMILNGTILDADVNASAAIAGTKISPSFGAQVVTATSDAVFNSVTVGRGAGAISTNTTVGSFALNFNTTGTRNTANGYQALYSNTQGDYNTATGYAALAANTTGYYNAAYGHEALASNTIGNLNTANGLGSLVSNTIGSYNTAVGFNSGSALTTGSNNTIIGSIAGTAGLSNTVIIGAGPTERLRITSTGTLNIVGSGTAGSTQSVSFNGSAPVNSLVLDSSGRVGIGTSSPSSPFHLSTGSTGASALFASTDTTAYAAGSFLANARLRIQGSSATGAYNGIGFGNNSNAEGFIGFVQNVSGYGDFVVQSYAGSYGEKLRVTSAGNVGIGTTSPSSLLHLADAGDITVGTTTGTKIGTATTQKLGFYNATPVVQPTAVANATTVVDVITQLNDLLAKLRTLGIIAT